MISYNLNIKRSLIAFFILLGSLSFAQVAMEKVLVEMGTATWNNGCANEVAMINQMKADGLNICVLNYHLNDPFANQSANQRASFYDIQTLPFPLVGGQEATIGDYSSYQSLYDASYNTPSSFTLSTSGHFSQDSLIIEYSIEKVADFANNEISAFLAISESGIPMQWFGQTIVDDVERAMSPDGNGVSLDFSSTTVINLNTKFTLNDTWSLDNMELVFFVQDIITKEILQCQSVSLTEFAPLPVHAFFQADDTLICGKEFIQFQNNSTGNVENSQWFTPGGTPSESTVFEPNIQYLQSGTFPVKLVVSNSISTDTLYVLEYIDVLELPNMSFNAFPDFCNDQESYELIEGNPLGGNYFGAYIDTGYFFPEEAGLGDHTIFYRYQEEETGCSDTISQIATVHFCTEISEQTQEFPFRIIRINREIIFIATENKHQHILQIEAYDIQGRSLVQKHFGLDENKSIKISNIPSGNLVVFRISTESKIYQLKYLLK